MFLRRFVLLLCAFLCAILAANSVLMAQDSAQMSSNKGARASASNDKTPTASSSDLRLGPGDLLELKVFGAPELGGTTRVSGAGEITVPLIGATKVSGLTPERAQKEIEQRLVSGGFLRDPHVNILVKEFASQGISVVGEVAHPGIYPCSVPRAFSTPYLPPEALQIAPERSFTSSIATSRALDRRLFCPLIRSKRSRKMCFCSRETRSWCRAPESFM